MYKITIFLTFGAILLGNCISTAASPPQHLSDTTSLKLTLPQPLTAEFGSEINPSISPDGCWLLYASDRSGNYDLWIRPSAGGIPTPLTTHPADDYSPVWSPKGDKICFVSRRDDPQGDLFTMNISTKRGKPRASQVRSILSKPGMQSLPSFSKKGKYITYQEDAGLKARIMLLRLGRKSAKSLTPEGYLQPRLAPQDNRILCIHIPEEEYGSEICVIHPGDLKEPTPEIVTIYRGSFPAAMPCWSPDGASFSAALVNQDRDRDGFLTAGDGMVLYRFDLVDETYALRPLSIGDANESQPYWAQDGYVYHISDRRGNPDLWRLPAEGPVPPASSAEIGFALALSIGQEAEIEGRSLTQQEILAMLLALDRLRRDFPDQRVIGARAMLESARLLRAFGDLERAETFLKRIPRLYPDQRNICAQVQIDYQVQVHKARFSHAGEFSCENPVSFMSNLKNILQEFPLQDISSARAHYLIGTARELLGDIEGALDSYNTVAIKYPEADDHPAEALLRIAAIYAKLVSGDEALRTYLDEIKRFPDRSAPTERAIQKVIELRVRGDDPIAGLQELIGRYPELPALTAAAQKRIADLLVQAREIELALGEYERLRGYAARHPIPYVRALLTEGLMASARLENARGEFLLAEAKLEEIEKKFSDLQDGYLARKARHMRIAMLAERAEWLNSQGDWELALANFERALALDPQNVRLHRGKIAAAHALGQLSEVAWHYRRQLHLHEDNPVLLYTLGLCLSYSGEDNQTDLQESNTLIQRTIAIQPELVYGYLTLSYNYERLENLIRQSKKPPGNLFAKSIRGIGKALNRIGRLITFRSEPQPFQGYEEAIETLRLGLAVNDERTNRELEAQMLLNLGNNYFRLGEFGYPRALTSYLEKLKYDSTFATAQQEALIRERMGRSAAVTAKNDLALGNYQRSLKLYHQTRNPEAELRLLLRLAELHQVMSEEEESNSYYRKALTLAEREGLPVSRTKWWENMAYNALNLGDDQAAIQMADKALTSLPADEEIPLQEIKNPLVLEFLGIPIPIWNFGYLGTGSPMSAFGFSEWDELLLNYSISQDVYNRQKNITASKEQALRRLAISARRQDHEAESILWSEIGYLNWAEDSLLSAKRCFIKSLNLCREIGLRGGELSALINLACIELGTPDTHPSFLENDSFPTIITLIQTFANEIDHFRGDPIGFGTERVRFYELYAELCLKASSTLSDTTTREQLRRLELEADALRALKAGIEEARKRELVEPGIRLRLILGDFLLSIDDLEGSAQELLTAHQQAETSGRDDFLWRIYWRFGRIGMVSTTAGPRTADSPLNEVLRHPPEEWFGLAADRWIHLPEEPEDLGTETRSKTEARLMFELAALNSIKIQDEERYLKYAQNIANLPIIEAARSRIVPVQFERRKFIWGGGGGTIPYLRGELQRLKRYTAELSTAAKLDTTELAKARQDLKATEEEYFDTLEKVKREDPEFASLFSMPTFSEDSLKALLEPGDLLIQILELGEEVHVILLDADSLQLLQSQCSSRELKDLRQQLLASDRSDLRKYRQMSAEYFAALFGLFRKRILSAERLFLIVPPSWSKVPFERTWTGAEILGDILPIYRLPDLQSLIFLRGKQSFGQGENLSFCPAENIPDFQSAALNKARDARKALENASVAFLRPQGGKVSHALDRQLFITDDKTWKVSDLLGIDSNGEALFLSGVFPDEGLLARIGFFAGFSSLIFLPNDLPESARNLFMRVFLESKRTYSPGAAYYRAWRSLTGGGTKESYLEGIHYFGDGGLDQQQRRDFARRNFVSTILKGNYNLEQGDGDWALKYYDRALAMAEEIGDSAATKNLHQLRIKAARKIPRWDEAIRSQQALIKITRRHRDWQALETGYRNLSVYFSNTGDLDQAISALLNARRGALERGDETRAASDDQILAATFERQKDYRASEGAILRAQQIFHDWEEFDQYIASGIYLGRLWIVQENFAQAARHLEDLGQRIMQLREETGVEIIIPAEYYQHLGLAYEGLTDYDSALNTQMKALALLGDTISATSALTHQYLAGLYWKLGRYQDGLDQLRMAKEQFSTLKLQQYVYLAENTEALIYLSLGDQERALEKAKSALESAIISGDSKSRSAIEKNLGLIELARGQPEKAKIRFLNSSEIDRKLGSIRGQAYAQLDLGNAYLQMTQLDSAQAALERALELGKQLSEVRVLARSYLGLGLVNIHRGKPKDARESLIEAQVIVEQRGLDELAWRVDLALARTAELDGLEGEALEAAERAMTKVEAMRAAIAAEGLKSGFMEDKSQIYALAAALHLRRGNSSEALNVAERSRSRTFLDLLQSHRISRKAGLEAEIEAEEANLSRRISKLRIERGWLKAKGSQRTPEEDSLLNQYIVELDSLETSYNHLLEEIESQHPGYRGLVAVDPEPPESIQARLRSGESLLEYYPVSNGMAIFVVNSSEIKARFVPISEDSLASLVFSLRNKLNNKLSIQEEAKTLYKWLIAPIDGDLAGCYHLIIVPSGPLHYLPFALLQDEAGNYLLDKFTLSFAPSASIFAFCRERSGQKPTIEKYPLLALGNPGTDLPQESLFFSEKEVTSIGFAFINAEMLLGNEAKESVLFEEAPNSSAVHLACHGIFDASNPMFSSLFLAPGGGEDGRLEMFEIFDLNLNHCSLVTLSACESGLGGIAGGEEIVGLTRSFIYAGSPRVISTLWKVDDLATAVLVKQFYRYLKSGMTPAGALRRAQQHVRRRIHPHPAYWAAFRLTGEPGGTLINTEVLN